VKATTPAIVPKPIGSVVAPFGATLAAGAAGDSVASGSFLVQPAARMNTDIPTHGHILVISMIASSAAVYRVLIEDPASRFDPARQTTGRTCRDLSSMGILLRELKHMAYRLGPRAPR
jgi:hypothetical protein